MFAMYLLHAGVLCEYSKGNKPSVITVSTTSLLVNFKAWSSSREFQDTRSNGATIILESCFVKVKYLNHCFSSRSALEKISSEQKSEECPRDDQVHVNIKQWSSNSFHHYEKGSQNLLSLELNCSLPDCIKIYFITQIDPG